MILFLHSGITNHNGIVDIGIAPAHRSLNLALFPTVCHWDEVRSAHCEILKIGVPLG